MSKEAYSLTDTVKSNPEIVGRNIDDELVLILPSRGQIKVINQVGARIWSLLDGENTLAHIASILSQEFDVPEETARQDILDFVDVLRQKNMLLEPEERASRRE